VNRPVLTLLMLGVVLLSGCAERADRLYQRAEAFFAQGQYQLAAQEYRRLVIEEPRSRLADNALYKLGYLYREELAAYPQAIQTYQMLVDRYPDSSYVDDSLLWIVHIEGQVLQDIGAVRQTYEMIKTRFPDHVEVASRAHLQVIKTLYLLGQYPQADAEAQTLLDLYPNQASQAAAAVLMRARVAQKINPKPEAAIKLYEQVVSAYPDTLSAAEAKRAIGWVYYGVRSTEMKAQLQAKQRAARVVAGVPPFGGPMSLRLKPFAALHSLLAQREVAATAEELLAVSGSAFEFVFSPTQPDLTMTLMSRNALGVAAEQYGFGVNVWSAASAEASFASLAQVIGAGRPVMVPEANSGGWMIVVGYRPAEETMLVLTPSATAPATWSRAQFMERWARSAAGHTACVTGPYFQLSLGERSQTPEPVSVLRNTARRAVEALGRREVDGVPAGLRAYDALAQQLAELATSGDPRALQLMRRFASVALPSLLADRRAAVRYLTESRQLLSGKDLEQIAAAASTGDQVVVTGQRLQKLLLGLTLPTTNMPPTAASWDDARAAVQAIRGLDSDFRDQLTEVAR
jgi:TolA-binding protein